MSISAPVFCPRFINRAAELGLLRERYHEARAGIGSTVLISGEAGIGKSRLLGALQSEVEADGGRFALGPCLEHSSTPLAPLSDLLRTLDEQSPSVFAAKPALRQALEDVMLGNASDTEPSKDRRGLLHALIEALRSFGALYPTVIAIDDAQWADLATAEFLPYIAARIDLARLLLVVTYRSENVAAHEALAAAIPKLGGLRRTWHVRLDPLEPRDTHALVVHALGERTTVDRTRLYEIVERAEGNPLFAEELLRDALEAQQAGNETRPLPLSVRAAVRTRIETLDQSDRFTLACAAAIGRRFDTALLGRVAKRSSEEIATLMRWARGHQLLFEDPKVEGGYVYRHALVQEALHTELLAEEMRAIHGAVATELERSPQDDERDVALAHHWWAAGNVQRARTAAEAAGDVAARRYAHHDAARMYERALAVSAPDTREQAILFEKLGRTLGAATPGQRSGDVFERAFAYWQRVDAPEKCAGLALELAQHAWLLSQSDASLDWRMRALNATAALPDHPLRFAALTAMVFHYALTGDPDAAQRYAEEADAFQGNRPTATLAYFHTFRGMTHLLRGEITPMLAETDRSIEVASMPSDDVHAPVIAYCAAGYRALNVGEPAIAERMFDAAVNTARERFVQDFEAYDVAGLALLMFLRGDWPRARTLLLESAALSADSNVWWIEMQQVGLAIPLALRSGDDELLERFAREEIIDAAFHTREPRTYGVLAAAFAELFAARGEGDRAANVLHRAVGAARSIGSAPTLGIAVARFGSLDDVPRARELYSRWAAPADNRAGAAYLALFEAIVAAREGRPEAPEFGADAAARFASIGFPYAEACALEIAGDLEEALSSYRAIGARRDVERLERKVVNRRGRGTRELTQREYEIAALVAEGASNRRIAEALSLSERTVEHHVGSILGKLGVESRAQVAALASRGGLPASRS